jgi:hypothetical protein
LHLFCPLTEFLGAILCEFSPMPEKIGENLSELGEILCKNSLTSEKIGEFLCEFCLTSEKIGAKLNKIGAKLCEISPTSEKIGAILSKFYLAKKKLGANLCVWLKDVFLKKISEGTIFLSGSIYLKMFKTLLHKI